jgi:hypothetical protein
MCPSRNADELGIVTAARRALARPRHLSRDELQPPSRR